MTSESATADLAARVMRAFGPAPANWVRSTGADHQVLVVGAGQAGHGIAFALRRAGIGGVSVIDAASKGETGVWTTVARMTALRTPKAWPEPEFGVPGLSFRAWYEAVHGAVAYERLDRIPRLVWADYLAWATHALDVPVRYRTRLLGLAGTGTHIEATLEISDGTRTRVVTETTRKLVLANGVEGTGGGARPAGLDNLPPHLAAHTGDRVDFARLAGATVGVLGAGASAVDAAAVALEAGAREVHLFTRRPALIIQGPGGFGPANLGARDNYRHLDDATKWRRKVTAARNGRSCTLASVRRAARHEGFRVHLNAAWHATEAVDHDGGEAVRVEAADGTHHFDFVISGAGYQYDPRTRADLAGIAAHIALWQDRYVPPADLSDSGLATHPYLGPGFELVEKVPGEAPWLSRVHVFSAAAGLSFGYPIGDVQSLAPEIPHLVGAIGRDLYAEDQALPPQPTTTGTAPVPDHLDAYAHAIWSPAVAGAAS